MPTARDFAHQLLARWTSLTEPPFIPERDAPAWAGLPPRERPLAFDLVTGIMRWRGALDAVIASRLRQPLATLEIPVLTTLWIGAFQLLFQTGTQDYAAVDAAVSLAHRVHPRAAGLVNAVLRGITRLHPVRGPLDTRQPLAAQLSRRALALDFQTQLFFNADIFPDPADLSTHLAAVRSHPRALVDHLLTRLGDALCAPIMLCNNQRPVITLRVDRPEISLPAAAGLLPHETPQFRIAAQGWNPQLEKLVRQGVLSPQDPAAAKPVMRFVQLVREGKISPPRRILDLCAGLGTKTIQLARAFPEAQVSAADIDASKLARLEIRARETGQPNIRVLPPQQPGAQDPSESFDAILVDAPCSNTGVLARRVQSRWRWPQLDRAALVALQWELLEQAQRRLSPGGALIYSTCSIDPAENQEITRKFRAARPVVPEPWEETTFPSLRPAAPHDGGYFAIHAPTAM